MSTDPTNGRPSPDDASSAADVDAEEPTAENADNPDAEAAEDADDAAVEDPAARIEALEERVEELENERDELNDRLLRKAAEFDNYRRRMEREKERRYTTGRLDVIEPMLEVIDDFERSLDAVEDLDEAQDVASAYESLKGGVEMVFRKFQDTLETLGVEPIEAEGQSFDENLHEAMMRQPTDDAEPGTVLQEIRKGYRMEDQVVRHSRVVVAAPPADEDEGEDAEA